MKPCLKLSNSSTPVLCSHRKCVAFGPQISEEVHVADEWDRTPTEPTRKLSYQDLLELKEIQRSLPHANQPYDLAGGRHFLSHVPITLLPLLPTQPVAPPQHKFMLDTPPSSGTSSPYSSSSSRTSSPPPSLLSPSPSANDTDPPTPSLSHTSLDSSPHSSPDPNPFLPLLLDDPDPHPHASYFPMRSIGCHKRPKQRKRRFIVVNDIEIEMESDDDSDLSDFHQESESELDHLDLDHLKHPPQHHFEPERSPTPTNSTLFSQSTPQKSCDIPPALPRPPLSILADPAQPTRSPFPQTHLPSCREIPSPRTPTTPKPPPTSPSINLHIPVMFKRSRSGSCLRPGAGAANSTQSSALAPALRGV